MNVIAMRNMCVRHEQRIPPLIRVVKRVCSVCCVGCVVILVIVVVNIQDVAHKSIVDLLRIVVMLRRIVLVQR